MAKTRNTRSMVGIVNDLETAVRGIFIEAPKAWVAQVREKMRDLPKTNFDLGCKFAEEGKWHDALFRFKIAVYMRPGYTQAVYNIGCCYYNLGNRTKARHALEQVLRENPQHQDAIFMLGAIDPSALSPDQRPKQMPREMITKFFGSIAAEYNQIEAQNQYRGGTLVAEHVRPLLAPVGLTVVDLGCGSGIAAIPYRAAAERMIGVELVPEMVAQARTTGQGTTKLFDDVIAADIAALNTQVPMGSADLVLLVNVVQFVGALESVMAAAAGIAKKGGVVAITFEPYTGSDAFGLVKDTGRFGHSDAYVKALAATYRLETVKQVTLALYPQTSAELLVLRKGGN